jgi:DNA invertase Pin-like site-specific DNA recombinase
MKDARPVSCAIYLRVSTRDQRYVQQFREIRGAVQARGWRVVRVYREKRSGAAGVERPAWRALRRDAQLRRFGAVAVWSLDRLGRSAIDILQAVEAFEARGIRLYIVKDGLETSGTAGRLIVTVLAGVAQLERDLISERTRLGLEAARRRGSVIGRPQARIPAHDLRAVREKRRTAADVARTHRVSPMTVRRHLATLRHE